MRSTLSGGIEQVSYELPDPKLTIAAFVNNLFDADALGFSLPNARAGGAMVVQSLRALRTYGIRLRYGF